MKALSRCVQNVRMSHFEVDDRVRKQEMAIRAEGELRPKTALLSAEGRIRE
jgi:hypothetical protein